ncbi:MAG: translocation/assembly module TamB domain-containing protein, partial [Myxococcota bacterium]
ESLSPFGIRVRGVHLNDPDGRTVIEGDDVYLVPDIPFALAGGLRFSHAKLDGGHVTLFEGADGLPSFLEAFASSDPDSPPSPEPFHAVVDDLRLENVVAEGTLLGIEGLRIENLSAHGRLEFEDEMVINVWDADGDIVAPWPFEARLEDLYTRIDSTPHEGTRLHATVRSGEQEVGVNLDYSVPDDEPLDADPELDILMNARPLDLATLGALGFSWAESFQGLARGHVRLAGPSDDLELRGTLSTEGGDIALRGALPSEGDVSVSVRTDGLNVGAVVAGAPELEIAGEASVVSSDEGTRFEADLEPFEYEGTPVPALRARGELGEDAVRIDEAELDTNGGTLIVSGTVDYEGNTELTARGDVGAIQREPLLASLLPGATGRLRIDGTVRLSGAGRLDLRGRFVIQGFRYGPVYVDRLVATGGASGEVTAPVLRFDLDVQGTSVSEVPLGGGEGRLVGGPTRYQASLGLGRAEQRIRFATDFRAIAGGVIASVPRMAFEGYGQNWQGQIDSIDARTGRIRVAGFHLEDGRHLVQGNFDWGFRPGTSDSGALVLQDVRLQDLMRWLPDAPPLSGTVDAEASFEGDFESQPNILVEGNVADLGAYGLEGVEADFLATHRGGNIAIDAKLTSETRGELDLSVSGILDDGVPIFSAWQEGSYESTLDARDVDLSLLAVLGLETAVRGRASGQLRASGAYGLFDFDGRFNAPRLIVGDFPALGLQSHVSYDGGSFIVRALTLDDAGELLEGEVSVLFDLASALEAPELILPMLEVAPWRASFRMAPRDLGTLPEPLLAYVPYAPSLRASATMSVRGGAFRPVADVIADVEWIGETGSARCGQDGIPRMAVRGSLRNGQAHLEARGLVRSQPVLFIEADAAAPVDEWVAGAARPEVPSTDMNVYLQNVPMHDLPVLCEYVGGPLNVVLQAQDVFTPRLRAFLDVAGDNLYIQRVADASLPTDVELAAESLRSPPFSVRAESRVSNGNASAELTTRWWNGGTLYAEGEAPVDMSQSGQLPTFAPETPIEAESTLRGTPLEAALFWLPGFGNIAGVTDGEVLLSGTPSDLRLDGAIELMHGEVALRSLGQRLSDVEGTLLFEDNRITLQNVFATDGDGTLRIAGDIGVENLVPSDFQLALGATDFPIRQEGSVIASLSGNAAFDATLEDEGLRGELRVQSLDVTLPEEDSRTPISLDPHPDVRLVQRNAVAVENSTFEVRLDVDGSNPIELQGEDLSATLTADLDVFYRDPDFRVGGRVDVLGGNYQLFGRRFDVEQGALIFDGASELDPAVTLVAVYSLRGQPGETVTVTASGTLSNLAIEFSSTLTNDRAEIIALLVSGNVR